MFQAVKVDKLIDVAIVAGDYAKATPILAHEYKTFASGTLKDGTVAVYCESEKNKADFTAEYRKVAEDAAGAYHGHAEGLQLVEL